MRTEHRSFEIRAEVDEERRGPARLVGTILTYGRQAEDRQETFDRGSLSWPKSGCLLNESHTALPIARFTPKVEGDQVNVDVVLPDTARSRDLLTLIRAGVHAQMSLEFQSRREEQRGGVRHILEGFMIGAAVVPAGSYGGGTSVEARSKTRRKRLWL